MNEHYRKYCSLECKKAAKKKGPARRKREKRTEMTSKERITRRLERMEKNMEDLVEATGLIIRSLNEIGTYLGQVPMATTQMILQSLRMVREAPVGDEEE